MSTSGRRVTTYDIASAIGVSQATVSYVLNRTPGQKIGETTRQRVLAAAAELGYRPFGPARTLRRGHSSVVLAALPEVPLSSVLDRLLAALADELQLGGLRLVICRARDAVMVHDVVDELSPAALISLIPLPRADVEAFASRGLRVEMLQLDRDMAGDVAVRHPQQGVGALQVGHLIEMGHRRIGYALPVDPRVRIFSEPRLRGALDAITAASLSKPLLSEIDDIEGALALLQDWVGRGITAVCCYNDDVALLILAGARRAGIAVPSAMAVIGVDDVLAASTAAPALTTIRTDMEYLAVLLASRVLGMEAPASAVDRSAVIRRESA